MAVIKLMDITIIIIIVSNLQKLTKKNSLLFTQHLKINLY